MQNVQEYARRFAGKSVTVIHCDGRETSGQLLGIDEHSNLLLQNTEERSPGRVVLSKSKARIIRGETVLAIGEEVV